MAQPGYDAGIPAVAPQVSAPDDTQNVRPTAAAGLQQLGAGISEAGQFYDNAAANNGFNDFMAKGRQLVYGDPNKTNPDGSPDTGFMGMTGAAAMNARPQIEAQLDKLEKQTLAGFSNDYQRQQFETSSRRYRNSLSIDIGSHTDQQSKAWYGQVNDDTAKNSLDTISADPLNATSVLHAASDLTNAYVKKAELAGAQPGEAVQNAKKDAFKAQVQAIGASDPAKALRMLQAAPSLAGTDYPALYQNFRTRADDQTATDFVAPRIQQYTGQAQQEYNDSPTNPTQPVYQQTAAAMPGGFSSSSLARLVQIESGGKDVTNASGHVGYGQFSDATWKQFGAGGNPHDLNDSVAAIQRYAVANGQYLSRRLGRPPTDAELYLAHQQGPAGAAALLSNPNTNAVRLLGSDAVLGNGGTTSMSAAQFVAMWTHKFNGTTPAANANISVPQQSRADVVNAANGAPMSTPAGGIPASPDQVGQTDVPAVANTPAATGSTEPSAPTAGVLPTDVKAAVFQDIDNSDMSEQQKQIARSRAAQQIQAYQIANDQSATAVKAQNDQAMNQYGTQILAGAGSADLQAQILGDPRLTFEGKKALTDAMSQHATQSPAAAAATYGPGFYKAMQQVLADPGDPSRISDPVAIWKRAQVGGDLTLQGAQYLGELMGKVTKSVDDSNTTSALSSLMANAKSKLSFEQDVGSLQIKDPEGEKLFTGTFVPRVLGAYDQWIKQGKDPWQFLTQENFDKMAQGIRNPREMAMARIASQQGIDAAQLPAPPTPIGMDDTGWKLVVNATPQVNGKALDPGTWAAVVQRLFQAPTPNNMAWFDSHFAGSNMTAEDVLDAVTPQTNEPLRQWPHFAAAPQQQPAAAAVPIPAPTARPQQAPAAGGGGF